MRRPRLDLAPGAAGTCRCGSPTWARRLGPRRIEDDKDPDGTSRQSRPADRDVGRAERAGRSGTPGGRGRRVRHRPQAAGRAPARRGRATDLALFAPSVAGEYLLILDIVTPEAGSLAAQGVEPTIIRVTVGEQRGPGRQPGGDASRDPRRPGADRGLRCATPRPTAAVEVDRLPSLPRGVLLGPMLAASGGYARHDRIERRRRVPPERQRPALRQPLGARTDVRLGFIDPRVVGVGDANAGLCGGMSWFVRDRFEAGQPIPADVTAPANGSPLFKAIVRRRSCRSTGCASRFASGGRRRCARRPSRRTLETEWPRIRAEIDAGRSRRSAWSATTAGTRSTSTRPPGARVRLRDRRLRAARPRSASTTRTGPTATTSRSCIDRDSGNRPGRRCWA